MNFDEMKNKVSDAAREHSDKVDQGLEKGSEAAKSKLGHDEQVDMAKDKAKEFLSGGE